MNLTRLTQIGGSIMRKWQRYRGDVRGWGAKSDGVTDNFKAFLDARNAVQASGKDYLYIPAGEYYLSRSPFIQSNSQAVHIKGDGQNSTVLRTAGGFSLFTNTKAPPEQEGYIVEGLRVVMPTVQDSRVFDFWGVSNNVIIRDVRIQGSDIALHIGNFYRAQFDNVFIDGANLGLEMTDDIEPDHGQIYMIKFQNVTWRNCKNIARVYYKASNHTACIDFDCCDFELSKGLPLDFKYLNANFSSCYFEYNARGEKTLLAYAQKSYLTFDGQCFFNYNDPENRGACLIQTDAPLGIFFDAGSQWNMNVNPDFKYVKGSQESYPLLVREQQGANSGSNTGMKNYGLRGADPIAELVVHDQTFSKCRPVPTMGEILIQSTKTTRELVKLDLDNPQDTFVLSGKVRTQLFGANNTVVVNEADVIFLKKGGTISTVVTSKAEQQKVLLNGQGLQPEIKASAFGTTGYVQFTSPYSFDVKVIYEITFETEQASRIKSITKF